MNNHAPEESALPSADAKHPPVALIESQEDYLSAIKKLSAGTGPFAVDAERASGFRYSQKAWLIQIYRTGGGVHLFDPSRLPSFDALQTLMRPHPWILHAASQDLACLREVGLDPQEIFDTELGARLAGVPKVGLGTLAEELLGVRLEKAHSAADWSIRPLPKEWLIYAALDVELLPKLRKKILTLLQNAGKTEIARQEFQAVLSQSAPARTDPWRRLSGLHKLRSPREQAIARALWYARDTLARERDIAPGRLIPDASIVFLAKAQPTSKGELAVLKNFTGRTSRRDIDHWWVALQTGKQSLYPVRKNSDTPPQPKMWAERKPEADARLKGAKDFLATVSDALNIPVENLLTPNILRRLAWNPPVPLTEENIAATLGEYGARPWQVDELARGLANIFSANPHNKQEPN